MYLEVGAIYRIKIPEDFIPDPHWASKDTLHQYWDGKLVRFEGENGLAGLYKGVFVDEEGNRLRQDRHEANDYCYFYPDWLDELVYHCPQVRQFISSRYVSPFDGKIK